MELDLDRLFLIAESDPLLSEAESALRQMGQSGVADALIKLQQDVGIEIDREMGGVSADEPPPGPQTALLANAYEPVSQQRLTLVLQKVARHFENPELATLMQSLGVPESSPAGRVSAKPSAKKAL